MFDKLIPNNNQFYKLFEQSAAFLEQGAATLTEAVANPEQIKKYADRLVQIEHEGDELTHNILIALDKSFITPIDREDIHELVQALDDCLDTIESVTERMQLYKISTPNDAVQQLASIIRQQAIQVHAALSLMPSFKYEKIIPHCKEISKLENQADKVGRAALVELFRGTSDPLQVMKWKDIYDYLEDVSDQCKHVAGIVERIVLKHG
jgi:predicted phosphate transport protein (TIGR00153 family)